MTTPTSAQDTSSEVSCETSQNVDTSCAARVEESMLSTLADLKAMYRSYDCSDEDMLQFCKDQGLPVAFDDVDEADMDDAHEHIRDARYDYGLCFDFVQPEDGENGYWCYLFSWGGPSTELRLYGMANGQLHRAEYWLLDWGDGACRTLQDDALETARVIFQDFAEMDMLQSKYEETMKG